MLYILNLYSLDIWTTASKSQAFSYNVASIPLYSSDTNEERAGCAYLMLPDGIRTARNFYLFF